ncbi:unnamed protein product [Soboliphyme baturini]|uniref:Regulator of G-protein signaling loco n=1 Tax=Soboliphyme baturini TaxID=241478 RepID=A0A183IKT1_9BILA|nr:unnamed protein product [Soboliphyme baturini]
MACTSLETGICHSVLVRRNNKGFGFTLKGECPCRINTVQKNSAAALAGLCAEDMLMRVNEIDVRRLSHREIVDMIADAGSAVLLAVQSPETLLKKSHSSRPAMRQQRSEIAPKVAGQKKRGTHRSFSSTTSSSRSERPSRLLLAKGSEVAVIQEPTVKEQKPHPDAFEMVDTMGVMLRSCRRRRSVLAQNKCASAPVFGDDMGETSLIVHAGDPSCLDSCSDDSDEDQSSDLVLKAVLVFIGAVTVPSLSTPKRSLKEQHVKTHTVMMEIYASYVILLNSKLAMIHRFVASDVAFVTTCIENGQYFCIVTQHCEKNDGSECFVFAIDPGLQMHSFHYGYAKKFGIRCHAGVIPNGVGCNSGCSAFPSCSRPVVRALSSVLKPKIDHGPSMTSRGGGEALTDRKRIRHSCVSSNSDSGISNAKDDEPHSCSTCELASVSGSSCSTVGGLQQFSLFPRNKNATMTLVTTKQKFGTIDGDFANISERSYSDPNLFVKSRAPLSGVRKIYKSMDDNKDSDSSPPDEVRSEPHLESVDQEVVKDRTSKKYATVLRRKLSNYVSSTWQSDKKKRAIILKERYEKWRMDFDDLLKDPFGVRIFTKFLTDQHCEENIEFWQQCEIYKGSDSDVRSSMAVDIHDQYFASGCTYPINVDSSVKRKVVDSVKEGIFDEHLFEPAQQQIFLLMKFDCYPRFLKWLNFDLVMSECESTSLKREEQSTLEKPLNASVLQKLNRPESKEEERKQKAYDIMVSFEGKT